MLALISPAKTLDYKTATPELSFTHPQLLKQSSQLIELCRTLSPAQIASLMHISDKLAGLNAARFAEWQYTHNIDNAKAAIYAFKGDVYTGLDIESLSDNEVNFGQKHIRILSGLYGLLRPLDLMQPYRLEMGTKLSNKKGNNLYDFWGNQITQLIEQELATQGDNILVNLASDEYFKSVNTKVLNAKIIKAVFLDEVKGKLKVVSFYAKKARGLMCRFIMQNKLNEITQLKEFNLAGYFFDKPRSSDTELVFTRTATEI